MALHTHLPIYRKGCDLVSLAYDVQKEMPRHFKRTLGEKIVALCMDMLDLMAEANASTGHDRAACIRALLKCQHRATVLLRVSHEKKCISHDVWAQSVELLGNIGRQGGASHNEQALICRALLKRGHAVDGLHLTKAYPRKESP